MPGPAAGKEVADKTDHLTIEGAAGFNTEVPAPPEPATGHIAVVAPSGRWLVATISLWISISKSTLKCVPVFLWSTLTKGGGILPGSNMPAPVKISNRLI